MLHHTLMMILNTRLGFWSHSFRLNAQNIKNLYGYSCLFISSFVIHQGCQEQGRMEETRRGTHGMNEFEWGDFRQTL